jgi:hypothetical protein
MSWTTRVFDYCERGLDPSFWAEPLNAVTNVGFLAAAAAGALALRRTPPAACGRVERVWLWALVILVAIIGIGSFLFHTFATRWARLADVLPITLFMLAYLAFALRYVLASGWLTIAAALPLFVASGSILERMLCPSGRLVSAVAAAREPCFNGSLGYAPALGALVVVGLLAMRLPEARRRGSLLLLAAAVFLVSVTLRTIDRDACAVVQFLGSARGTHAAWHLLNGVTLYLLLKAAIVRNAAADRGRSDGAAPR